MCTPNEPPKCDLDRADFEAIVDAANQGNPEALDRLRHVLDDSPSLWRSIADLGSHCETILINLITGSNVLLRESLHRLVAEIRAELLGENSGVLREMAAQRVINTWLFVSHLDVICPAPASRQDLQRSEAAQRQFDRAVKAWKSVTSGRVSKVLPRPLRVVG